MSEKKWLIRKIKAHQAMNWVGAYWKVWAPTDKCFGDGCKCKEFKTWDAAIKYIGVMK